jgi:putative SOS response-associated peptidase YedK
MCGRYATTRSAADLSALFESLDSTGAPLPADYNVAPTDPVPIVRISARAEGRVLSLARWGLVPAWAGDARGGARMINARAETVATSRAYGPSFARRRCLVPADGWYEWVRGAGAGRRGAQAYFMTPRDGGVLAFAGLWSTWDGGPQPLLTCSVVTTAALGELARVHDRMPLVLPRERWGDWLARGGDATELLAVPPEEFLGGVEIRPVGPAVGDVRNDGPRLVEEVAVEPPEEPVELTLF